MILLCAPILHILKTIENLSQMDLSLLDAQKHPENYRNLIVRVWGWSGYFVELDKCYQDHIIRRAELLLS